jgi:hypothetical protein
MRWRKVVFNGLTGRNQRSAGVYVAALFAVIRNDVVTNDSRALIQAWKWGREQGTVKCKSLGIGTKRSSMSDPCDFFICLFRPIYVSN